MFGKKSNGRKSVLVVGAGAAGMSAAYHLSQHPEKFPMSLIDAVDYCGGQAFAVPIDKNKHGASWFNQGVQGGSNVFHHTMTMFARQGYHADPVQLQVSFGKDDKFWTNVFPTESFARHQTENPPFRDLDDEERALVRGLLRPHPAEDHVEACSSSRMNSINFIALPMTALFLGTGNATPEPTIMLERLCTSPTYGVWYPPEPDKTSKAVISGIAAAVDLGAEYPADLERDGFALLVFGLYYLLVYGRWYWRRVPKGERVGEWVVWELLCGAGEGGGGEDDFEGGGGGGEVGGEGAVRVLGLGGGGKKEERRCVVGVGAEILEA